MLRAVTIRMVTLCGNDGFRSGVAEPGVLADSANGPSVRKLVREVRRNVGGAGGFWPEKNGQKKEQKGDRTRAVAHQMAAETLAIEVAVFVGWPEPAVRSAIGLGAGWLQTGSGHAVPTPGPECARRHVCASADVHFAILHK